MNFVRVINVSFQIWGSVMIAIIILSMAVIGKYKRKADRLFIALALSNMMELLMDAVALYFRGRTGIVADIGVRASNCIEFLMGSMLSIFFLLYVKVYIEEKTGKTVRKIYEKITMGLFGCSVVMILINLYKPFIYVIGSDNLYRRLQMYPLIMLPAFLMLVLTFILVTEWHRKLNRWEKILFYLYIFAPFIGMIGTTLVYGIVFGHIGTTLVILILFILSMIEQNKYLIRQDQELTQLRIDMMLSQIQPHFLYNTLGMIGTLCMDNPQLARNTVDEFARYLRTNLDSLDKRRPISLEKELDHTKTYVELEKLRFGENICVEYQIETLDCVIPLLTIQPLVENAILHGMMGTDRVCHICIATKKLDNGQVEISVCDDGIGFDVHQKKQDGRNHIGLENVKKRVQYMVNGTLAIHSIPGEGTKVTILIPKQNKE